MQTASTVLLILGGLFTLQACLSAGEATNFSYLVGTFVPGLLFAIIGLSLRKSGEKDEAPDPETPLVAEVMADAIQADPPTTRRPRLDPRVGEAFGFRAAVGLAVGVGMMLASGSLSKRGPDWILPSLAIMAVGIVLMLGGCVYLMRWKGYSGWFAFLGYLLLIGLIALACFPNRRKRYLVQPSEDPEGVAALARADGRAGYPYLAILAPCAGIFGLTAVFVLGVSAPIGATEWNEVRQPERGFQALMPGTPRVDENVKDVPDGKVELYKYQVEPKGKRELFMIYTLRFPPDVAETLGGRKEMLQLGKTDFLQAMKGQLKSEKNIALQGVPGLEVDVLPPKGAIARARVFATDRQLFVVCVHVPMVRIESEDVSKYLNSFQLVGANP